MPLDPQIKAILDLLAQSGSPSLASGTPEQARTAFRFTTVDMRDPSTLAEVASVDDTAIDGPAGRLPVRIYRPLGPPAATPTIVFFHGGGFVIGDLDTHDDAGRLLCRDLEAVVVSVDYRLAPEHPFPAGFEDCLAATRWVAANIADLGGDPAKIAVAGDSAGGNLAAAVAIAARESGPAIAAQLLIYPAVDFSRDGDYPSRVDNAEGYFLTQADMDWFRGKYLTDAEMMDPRASVLHAPDLTGLPPAVIGVAEFDPLRDEGEAFARKLTSAGVDVVLHRFDGLVHGFFGMGVVSTAAAEAVTTLTGDFKKLLA